MGLKLRFCRKLLLLRYMFVANSDNLGASVDLRMLGHLERSKAPMLMEVCVRGEADRKGGHLARMVQSEKDKKDKKDDQGDKGKDGKESHLSEKVLLVVT